MKTTCFLSGLAALGALGLVGCSTPATRISANPQAFSRLSPADQALVRAGRIREGFDSTAVRLALGNPDYVTERTSAVGQLQIWHYGWPDSNSGYFAYPESSATSDPIHGDGEGDSPRLAGLVQSASNYRDPNQDPSYARGSADGVLAITFRNGTVIGVSYR